MTLLRKPGKAPVPQEHGASRGAIVMLLSFGGSSLFAYAYAVVMSWLLPVAAYGAVGVLQAVLLVGSTAVNSGVPWAVAHRISRHPEGGVSRTYIGAAVTGNALFGALLGGLVLAAIARGWAGLGRQGAGVAGVVATTVVVFAISAAFTGVLQGFMRLGAYGSVRASEAAVRFGAAVLLVAAGGGVLGAVSGFLFGGVVAVAWSAVALRGLPIASARLGGRELLSEYRDVGSFLVVMVCLAGLTYADLIGVSVFSAAATSAVSTGQYQAAIALSRVPVFLTLSAFTAIYPYAARESSHQAPTVGYAQLSLKFFMLLLLPMGLVFALMPQQVLGFFFPGKYAESSDALAFSGIAVIFLCAVYAWSLLLQASGRLRVATTVLPIALACEFVALAFLVPALGDVGAAVALALVASAALAALVVLGQPVLKLRVPLPHVARYLVAVGLWSLALALCPHDGRVVTAAWLAGAVIGYIALLAGTRLLTRADVTTLLGGLLFGHPPPGRLHAGHAPPSAKRLLFRAAPPRWKDRVHERAAPLVPAGRWCNRSRRWCNRSRGCRTRRWR